MDKRKSNDKSRQRQQRFADNKAATHSRLNLWLSHKNRKEIEQIAEAQGWINTAGRNAGKPNLQRAIKQILQTGIEQYKD